MLQNISQTLGKKCLIGLSYFNANKQLIKQSSIGGVVTNVDETQGITIELAQSNNNNGHSTEPANFIIPANLSCWFVAPKGDFHTNIKDVKISNPDYLVTWDIYQTDNKSDDGEHQWWQWRPRTTPPALNQ